MSVFNGREAQSRSIEVPSTLERMARGALCVKRALLRNCCYLLLDPEIIHRASVPSTRVDTLEGVYPRHIFFFVFPLFFPCFISFFIQPLRKQVCNMATVVPASCPPIRPAPLEIQLPAPRDSTTILVSMTRPMAPRPTPLYARTPSLRCQRLKNRARMAPRHTLLCDFSCSLSRSSLAHAAQGGSRMRSTFSHLGVWQGLVAKYGLQPQLVMDYGAG
ncbi:hypothetical protein F4802DRAFT_419523 [Xylaria palmicola]|nr:hypothetical protein F4802DRAFT_419523 [Xylaria palmicola]